MLFEQNDRLMLLGNPPITTNNPTSIPDDLFVSEGPAGRWMSIPLSQEEVSTMHSLPKSAKEEFKKNVHEYIGQLGKEYKALTAMPLDEAPYAG
jgi:hypothetical protein